MADFVGAVSQSVPDRVREALWTRGVTDEQISLFQIGHVNGALPDVEYPDGFAKWCSVGDRLDDSYVLPLTNVLGEVRGVQFRHVDRARGGYMDYIEANDEAIFFGLGQAAPHMWASRGAFLVEGGFDLFPVQRVYPATIGTLTARVTEPLLRLLRRLVTRVWLGYDMDDAGRRACARYKKQLTELTEFQLVKVVEWPRCTMVGTTKLAKDPADIWETWGDAKFQEHMKKTLLGV
jgi:DNA primase